METFQKQLKKRAEQLHLSLAEVARQAGISERRIGHYSSGRSEPDLATLVKIATVLKTTPDGLLMGHSDVPDAGSARQQLLKDLLVDCDKLTDERLELIIATVRAWNDMR